MSTTAKQELEIIAITRFGMPKRTKRKLREAYLAYLQDALYTTCTPTIWPPESWFEYFDASDL